MGNDVVVENRNRFYKNRLWARELSEARCLPALALNGTSGRVKFRLPAADSKIIINAKHSIKPHTFSLMIESYKYRMRLYSVLHLECRTPVERCLDERHPYLCVRDGCGSGAAPATRKPTWSYDSTMLSGPALTSLCELWRLSGVVVRTGSGNTSGLQQRREVRQLHTFPVSAPFRPGADPSDHNCASFYVSVARNRKICLVLYRNGHFGTVLVSQSLEIGLGRHADQPVRISDPPAIRRSRQSDGLNT
jgi:hypothetical protein